MIPDEVINMPKASASKRAYNAKWTAENMTTLQCRIKKEYADQFRTWCKDNGTTVSGVIGEFVYDTIGDRPPEK